MTLARENRRLKEALAQAHLAHTEKVEELTKAIKDLERQGRADRYEIHQRELTIAAERLQRVSAQRGLVNYMKEHGLSDRIGYDPDKDPDVVREIAEGLIPPRDNDRLLREIAETVIAERLG